MATLVFLAPAAAHAFADPSQFLDNPKAPHAASLGASGEGVYFTGAPRFASLNCQSCHINGPGRVGLHLGADDQALFRDGYSPNNVYLIEVALRDEWAGTEYATPSCTDPPGPRDTFPYVQCNNNGFALEIDSAKGPLAGSDVFCARDPLGSVCPMPDPFSDETVVAPGGDAVFANRIYSADPNTPKLLPLNGMTSWHFWWKAPKEGTGPVTFYISAVDGNGGDGVPANDQDPFGDDTVQGNFFIQEAGSPVSRTASASCALAPGPAPLPAGLLLAALVALVACHRRLSPLEAAKRPGERRRHGSQPPVDSYKSA